MQMPWRGLSVRWRSPARSDGDRAGDAPPSTGDVSPGPPEANRSPGFFVVVARHRPDLLDVCRQHFAADARMELLIDRREGERRIQALPAECERRRRDRRAPTSPDTDLRNHTVIVVPVGDPAMPPDGSERASERGGIKTMLTEVTVRDDRERLEHWMHESQDLLGQVIPGLLNAGERAHARSVQTERECDALREDNQRLTGRIKELEIELARDRAERLEMLDAVNRSMAEMTRPFNDLLRKLGSA
jgi:hypothetical protein